MLAYLAGLIPLETPDETLFTYFSGSDFKPVHVPFLRTQEFKEQFIQNIRELKSDIDIYSRQDKFVRIGGGEPLLQRAPLIYLISYLKSKGAKIHLETNGSKPEILNEVVSKGMVDRVTMFMHAPLEPEQFQKVTKAGTFFKAADEIIKDIKESLSILKNHEQTIDIRFRTMVVPSLMYKKEELHKILSEIKNIKSSWELIPFSPEGVEHKKYSGIKSPGEDFMERLRSEFDKEIPTYVVSNDLYAQQVFIETLEKEQNPI